MIVYFLVKGEAGYVLPRYQNRVYKRIKEGEHFGHVDLAEDNEFLSTDDLTKKRVLLINEVLVRRFTV